MYSFISLFQIQNKKKMSIIKSKSDILKIKRTTYKDISGIIYFHKKSKLFETPKYLNDVLTGETGISLVAYQNNEVVGHLLILPMFSGIALGSAEAAIICGIWSNKGDITKKLIKEATMTSWESGYHVLFSLEKNESLTKIGFKPISKDFFSFDTSKFYPMAMELSWEGCSMISKKQFLPGTFLPSENFSNQFSKN